MYSYKESLAEAISYLTMLGHENIDINDIDIRFGTAIEGCCELCRTEVDVRIIDYLNKEYYL